MINVFFSVTEVLIVPLKVGGGGGLKVGVWSFQKKRNIKVVLEAKSDLSDHDLF